MLFVLRSMTKSAATKARSAPSELGELGNSTLTYRWAMQSLPSVRMTANLNSMIRGQQSIEQAERAIVGDDVAHHVIDPEEALGLDPLQASTATGRGT